MFHRRSIRLKDYDYTQNGAYFVTICTHHRLSLFGDIADDTMNLNPSGMVVQSIWESIPTHHPHVELDASVVMPNHIHGIIVIAGTNQSVGVQRAAPSSKGITQINVAPGSLGAIIRSFKSAATQQINQLEDAPNHPIWQRNYHEHVIRNEEALNYIRRYVVNNPAKWAEDSLFIKP